MEYLRQKMRSDRLRLFGCSIQMTSQQAKQADSSPSTPHQQQDDRSIFAVFVNHLFRKNLSLNRFQLYLSDMFCLKIKLILCRLNICLFVFQIHTKLSPSCSQLVQGRTSHNVCRKQLMYQLTQEEKCVQDPFKIGGSPNCHCLGCALEDRRAHIFLNNLNCLMNLKQIL